MHILPSRIPQPDFPEPLICLSCLLLFLVCAIQNIACVAQKVQELAEAEKRYLEQNIASLQNKLSESDATQARQGQVKQALLQRGI